jgi:hypothetical protein
MRAALQLAGGDLNQPHTNVDLCAQPDFETAGTTVRHFKDLHMHACCLNTASDSYLSTGMREASNHAGQLQSAQCELAAGVQTWKWREWHHSCAPSSRTQSDRSLSSPHGVPWTHHVKCRVHAAPSAPES